jgi:hypothetical protein
MPGILERLGSFGRRIIDVVRETGRSIADAIAIARPIAPEVTEPDVLRDWGKVTRITERESLVASLPKDQAIPDYLYTTSDVPFKRPYAYTVTIQGRAVAGREGPGGIKIGGRFVRDEFNVTASRPLTPEEVEEEAMRRFGAAGAYPLVSIRTLSVTAAMKREI